MSACPAMSEAVTLRHNAAGTEIVEAICRGEKRQYLITSDVGVRRRLSPDELPAGLQYRRFMRDVTFPACVPPMLQQALREYTGSVPDAFMAQPTNDGCKTVYTIVEIKYCRDTDPTHQEQAAHEQHAALAAILEGHPLTESVQRATLTLGVSGTIYKTFMHTMQDMLGVKGPSLNTLARRLHLLAVTRLHDIWRQRMARVWGRQTSRAVRGQRMQRRMHDGRKRGKPHTSRNTGAGAARVAPKRARDGGGRNIQEPEHRKRRKKR